MILISPEQKTFLESLGFETPSGIVYVRHSKNTTETIYPPSTVNRRSGYSREIKGKDEEYMVFDDFYELLGSLYPVQEENR